MSIDALQQLMAEIGPALDLAEVMAFPDQQLWTLAFDDGEVVEVACDESGERALFSIEVGDLGEDGADGVCRTLLQFNLLWQQTGGLRFALAGESAILTLELPVATIDVPTLATMLVNFHEQALHWRPLLTGTATPSTQPSQPAGHAIRV